MKRRLNEKQANEKKIEKGSMGSKVLVLTYKFIFAALIAAVCEAFIGRIYRIKGGSRYQNRERKDVVKRDDIQQKNKIGKAFTFKSSFPLKAGNVLLKLPAEPKVDEEVEAAVEGEADMADQHQEVEPVRRWSRTVRELHLNPALGQIGNQSW